MTCPNCSISLTYHSANQRLMCHYCGYSEKADTKCPQCGGERMKFLGAGTQKNDLTEIMIRHERLQRQREIEIREEIFRLTEEEEVINRIRVCYQALRGKEYGFLRELYVRGHPYKVVEKNSGVSHGTFERIRKSGIRKIQQMYASNFSNQEIIAKSSERHKRKSKKGGGEKYEQIKLDL